MTTMDTRNPLHVVASNSVASGSLLRDLRCRLSPRGRDEEGSGVVDLIVVAPILISVLLLAIGLGRVRNADQIVGTAADDAARAASLQRTVAGAQAAALDTVAASLSSTQSSCAGGPAVSVDLSRWQPGGSVSVDVSCTAMLADLAAPGLPGSATLTARGTSPIEAQRSVTP